MSPTVSVIIPFYNRIDWLEEAVKSVLNQTYKVHEIIIINDGSKEDVTEFLNTFGSKVKFIKKENGGPAIARNLGIEISTGDYVAFLDSDDIWLPRKLERQISLMEVNKAVWSHTSYETFIDGSADKTVRKSVSMFNGHIYPEMLPSFNIATPCVVVNGSVIRKDKNLRFNPKMRYGEDHYLWINLAVRYEVLAIDEILTKVRIRGSNAALRARVQLKSRAILWKYIKKNEYFKKKIPIMVSFAYNISILGANILNVFEKNVKNDIFLEYLSRILYIIPWIIFKANAKR